jgi:hypothetical protein
MKGGESASSMQKFASISKRQQLQYSQPLLHCNMYQVQSPYSLTGEEKPFCLIASELSTRNKTNGNTQHHMC